MRVTIVFVFLSFFFLNIPVQSTNLKQLAAIFFSSGSYTFPKLPINSNSTDKNRIDIYFSVDPKTKLLKVSSDANVGENGESEAHLHIAKGIPIHSKYAFPYCSGCKCAKNLKCTNKHGVDIYLSIDEETQLLSVDPVADEKSEVRVHITKGLTIYRKPNIPICSDCMCELQGNKTNC